MAPPPKKKTVRRAGKKYFLFTIEELLISVAREYFVNKTGDLSIFSTKTCLPAQWTYEHDRAECFAVVMVVS